MKKFISVISAVIAVCFLFVGCASSSYSKDSMSLTAQDDYNGVVGEYYDSDMLIDDNGGVNNGGANAEIENNTPSGRKIVLTASISYETKKYDESLQLVLKEITANGGYVQNSNYYGDSEYSTRGCSITARIPSDNYTDFLSSIDGAGSLINKSESSDDITAQYVDVEARLTSLKTEEETLLGILEQATTIEDVIALQDKLTEVRYQIEYYTSTQRTYDDMVDYSTVTIELDEVMEYTPVQQGFGDRIKAAVVDSMTTFVNGMQDVVIALIFLLPSLILLGLIVLIIVVIVKVTKKNNRKKRAAMMPPVTGVQAAVPVNGTAVRNSAVPVNNNVPTQKAPGVIPPAAQASPEHKTEGKAGNDKK